MGENSDHYWNTKHEIAFIRKLGTHKKENHRVYTENRYRWLQIRKTILEAYISTIPKRRWDGNYDRSIILRVANQELTATIKELYDGEDPAGGR